MPPPAVYVMSSEATGPRDDRQPAGVLHAAPSTHPPTHRSFCGRSEGLFWFGHVDFWATTPQGRCPDCMASIEAALGAGGQAPGFRLPPEPSASSGMS